MSVDDPLPSTPLRLVTIEVEAHVAADGWDQPPRLYALVPTAQLVEHEPGLAASLSAQPVSYTHLTLPTTPYV